MALLLSYIGGIAGATAEGYAATIDGLPGGAPLAHWRFGEAAGAQITDQKAAFHGTYSGTIGYGAAGLPEGSDDAVDFGGTGSGQVNHDAGLQLSAFSLSFWFRVNSLPPDADPNETLVLISKDQSGLNLGDFSVFVFEDASLNVNFQTGAGSFSISSAEPIQIDTTYHIVVRADGSGFDAYLNGRYLGKRTEATDAWASNMQPIGFATAPWAIVDGDCTLDEVAIYPRVITEAEVLRLAQVEASAPVANNLVVSVPEGDTTVIAVTENDSYVGTKAGLTVEIMSQPAGGDSVVVNGNNDIEYTAGAVDENTARSFTYRITDATGLTSSAALVLVTVEASDFEPAAAGLCILTAAANETVVSSMSGLAAAVAAASPGGHILIAPGTYSGGELTLAGKGAQGDPIVIKPQNGIGTVTIGSGTWTFAADSSFMVLEGLYFATPRINVWGQSNRITRCRFRNIDINAPIHIHAATDCRFDHLDFSGWVASDTGGRGCIRFVPNYFATGESGGHLIDYCYIHDITPNVGTNGQEVIKWFASADWIDLPADPPVVTMDHLLIADVRIPSESEIISIKSGGVKTQFCTFERCGSMRHGVRTGNNCEFRSNWFDGMRVTLYGENHLFIGNRMVGTGASARLIVGSGNSTQARVIAGTDGIGSYAAATNCQIVHNIVGSTIEIGEYFPGDNNPQFPALNNNVFGNTGTVNLDPNWESGTTTTDPSLSFVAAVKLTPEDVGLEAPDPLCD